MKVENRKVLSTAFTLTGTIIGAGILGLPYVFAKAGFFIGLFWLVLIGIVMILLNLYLGEVTLRTKKAHQLPGYSEKYLGKFFGKIMFIALIFGIYSALVAYLIGSGQSFSKLFFGGVEYSIFCGVLFWIGMAFLLRESGLTRLKNFEFWGVFAIILIIVIIFFSMLPGVKFENVTAINLPNIFLPFGVVLFALLGFNSIPELNRELGKDKKMLKKSIFVGVLIPIILYILFCFVFVGVFGGNVSEIATLSLGGIFGKSLLLLGIFTMTTSFFVLSFALRDYFIFDLKNKKISFIYVSIIPLILYLLISIFNLAGFIKLLGIGGVISGGIAGILILITNFVSKKKGNRNPEYSIPINWFIIVILGLMFLLGIWFELF